MLSLVAMVCFGVGDTIGTYLSRHVSSARLMLLDTLVGIGLYNTVVFFSDVTWVMPTTIEALYLLGLAGGTMFGTIALFQGLSSGRAGIVVPVANSYALVSVILGVFVLGEILTGLQLFAIGIVVVGLFFLSFDIRDLKRVDRSIVFGFTALFFWGLMTFFAELVTQTMHPFVVVAYNNLIMSSLIVGYLLFTRQKLLSVIERKHIYWGMGMSSVFAIGFLSFLTGFYKGSLSIVAVIGAASPLITAVLAHRFLGDKLNVFQYAMVCMAVGGIMLLAW